MNKFDDSGSAHTHFTGRYLGIRERDGWEFATRTNATGVVVVVAVTDKRELVLVEQFRIPVNAQVIELPAGLVGDHGDADEPVANAAHRELREETGFRAGHLVHLFNCPSSAGMSDEQLDIFLATDLVREGPGGGDASEDIRVHLVPLDRINSWLANAMQAGKALDPKIYAALYWAEHQHELGTLFPDNSS
jgi:ADP-ribose pyrophosphatase